MPSYYLPWVATPAGPVGAALPCGMGAEEYAVFVLLSEHPDQERTGIRCDARLVQAARARCELFRQVNGLAAHYPMGVNPHKTVVDHGYKLPDVCRTQGPVNYIESAAVGQRPAYPAKAWALGEEVVAAWIHSPKGHMRHVLGLIDWYREQTVWGVGYSAQPSEQGWAHWWCFLSVHPE